MPENGGLASIPTKKPKTKPIAPPITILVKILLDAVLSSVMLYGCYWAVTCSRGTES